MDAKVLDSTLPAQTYQRALPSNWDFSNVARVLSSLIRAPVTATQAREKASGLGLAHYSLHDNGIQLSAKAFSRLLLAGYHLPAQVEVGTARRIRRHLARGRRVFLNVPAESDADWAASASALGSFIDGEFASWVLAAGSWSELAAHRGFFFSGSRDDVDCYHWATAECDTGADGRILRYW